KSNLAWERRLKPEPPTSIAGGSEAARSGRAGLRASKGPFVGSDGGRRRCNAAAPEPMCRELPPAPSGTAGRPRHRQYKQCPRRGARGNRRKIVGTSAAPAPLDAALPSRDERGAVEDVGPAR